MTNIILKKMIKTIGEQRAPEVHTKRGTYKEQTKNINIKSTIHNNKRKYETVTRRQLYTDSETNQNQ
jgi:hypothetical protein